MPSSPIKIACIGDSITFGAAIKEHHENSYPRQLARLLGNGYCCIAIFL